MPNQTTLPVAPVQQIVHRPWTAPQLFAGVGPAGVETCFYCGGSCEPIHPASEIVKKSFTGLDTVTLSQWVCTGCVESMDEKAAIVMLDGVKRSGQKTRGYSWVITKDGRTAADVMAYLARFNLPVHPAYGMLGSGRYDRERIRVATLGGERGGGAGRREWESEYYGDVLNRIAAKVR